MMRKIIILFCFWILTFSLKGQNQLYDLAETAYLDIKWNDAYKLFRESGEQYQNNESYEQYIHCNLRMADCLIKMGEYTGALSLTENTIQYIQKLFPSNKPLLSDGFRLNGESLLNIGKNKDALEALKQAEAIYDKSPSLPLAETYNMLGVIYMNNQNLELANQYHTQALEIRQKLLPENSVSIGDSYNNLGLLFIENDQVKANEYLDKALEIYEKTLGTLHPKVGYALLNLSKIRTALGWYEDGTKLQEKANFIWDKIYPENHPAKAFTLLVQGDHYETRGNYPQALYHYEQALQQYIQLFGDTHPEVSNTYFLIGSVYQKQSNFKASLQAYQHAIFANLIGQEYGQLYAIPKIENYLNADYLLRDLLAKAKILEALHFEKSLKPRDLKAAIFTYQQADSLVSKIRSFRQTEFDKIRLGEIANLIYENGIQMSLVLAEQPFFYENYNEIAFNFCERSKAAVLLAAIQDSEAKDFAGIPNDIIRLEDSMKIEISYLQQVISKDAENKLAQKKLFEVEREYRALLDRMAIDFPAYFDLKHTPKLADLKSIQSKLKSDELLISYFEGAENRYIFQINREGLKITVKSRLENEDKLVNGFRNAIYYKIDAKLDSLAQLLYASMMPDIGKQINHLILIPAGRSQLVPFEAMKNPENKKYLIQEKSVSYTYAATLWQNIGVENADLTNKNMLCTAPVIFDNHSPLLASLSGSEKEVNDLRFLAISNDIPVEKLIRKSATETAFKTTNLQNYKYIHLATHGEVNPEKPALSRIFLQPDSTQDGSLFTGEIYSLKMNAELVALSACETGLGKLATGEGILGLSRALIYAGSKNLIVSQWKVADQSTADLMLSFYQFHLSSSSKMPLYRALQKAKTDMINSVSYSQPYYWAPFILIGR